MMTIDQISRTLLLHHPAQLLQDEFPGFTRAAVLIPLFKSSGDISLLLTMRTSDVETHKGQISFPGGMQDSSDQNAVDTALREMHEELGIEPRHVRILGTLDDHPVPSKFIITPVVGYLEERPSVSPNSSEVAEVFDVPLSFFGDRKNGRSEERELYGKKYVVWFYQYEKYLVWGATAAMIRNLIGVAGGY